MKQKRLFASLVAFAALFIVLETSVVKGVDAPFSLADLPRFRRADVNIFGRQSLEQKALPDSAIEQFSILLRRLPVSEALIDGLSLPPNDYVFELYNHKIPVGELRISFRGGMIEF